MTDPFHYYMHEKNLIREAHGLSPLRGDTANRQRPAVSKKMDELAAHCKHRNVDPYLWVKACFVYAKSQRHPDGPMINMLASPNYAAKAISHYLNIPIGVVWEKSKTSALVEKREEAFQKNRAFLLKSLGAKTILPIHVSELSMLHSVPAVDRLLVGILYPATWQWLSEQVMDEVEEDVVLQKWLESKGWPYEKLAERHNAIKNADTNAGSN